jgi:hypothetical protein
MTTLTRQQFIDSMSTLLARLANDDIPVPQIERWAALTMPVQGDDARARLAHAVKLLGCGFTATVRSSGTHTWLHLAGDFGGIPIVLRADAEDVCDRAVTGSYQVGNKTYDTVRWIVPDTLIPGGKVVDA